MMLAQPVLIIVLLLVSIGNFASFMSKRRYCELYDCGFKRLGCVGCPLATRRTRMKEFSTWPTIYQAYLKAFEKMLEARRAKGKLDETWRIGTEPQDIMNWWLESGVLPGQYDLFEIMEET